MLEAREELRRKLPHLYLHKRYKWSREFEEEYKYRYQVVCAANQLGKSSTAIQKVIRFATEKEKWPIIWPNLKNPETATMQFWYLYPSYDVTTTEFENKWRALLPKVPEDDPVYGWQPDYARKHIKAIYFNSGVNLYFKSYSQDANDLQSGSVHMLVSDEELPTELLPELQMRTAATDGLMCFVFTATRGQPFWRQVIEERNVWSDISRVWQVPLHECQRYEDGSASLWTPERISAAISRCMNQNEIDKRILGKFVADEGRKFPEFSRERHMEPYRNLPPDWPVFFGIDHGSGGAVNHPAAITAICCEPNYKSAYVIRHWRGDLDQTTSKDTVEWYIRIAQTIKNPIIANYYDFHAKDVGMFAQQAGLPFLPAEKNHDIGEGLMNVLLKCNALKIFTQSSVSDELDLPGNFLEGWKMADEFESLLSTTSKISAKDDSVDSLRYALAKIPFNLTDLADTKRLDIIQSTPRLKTDDELRREAFIKGEKSFDDASIEEELTFWAGQLDD